MTYKVGDTLIKKKYTISITESLTSGNLQVAFSPAWFFSTTLISGRLAFFEYLFQVLLSLFFLCFTKNCKIYADEKSTYCR